jgi:hypothetical protein
MYERLTPALIDDCNSGLSATCKHLGSTLMACISPLAFTTLADPAATRLKRTVRLTTPSSR